LQSQAVQAKVVEPQERVSLGCSQGVQLRVLGPELVEVIEALLVQVIYSCKLVNAKGVIQIVQARQPEVVDSIQSVHHPALQVLEVVQSVQLVRIRHPHRSR